MNIEFLPSTDNGKVNIQSSFPWTVAGDKFRSWYEANKAKLAELFTPEWQEEYEDDLPGFAFDIFMGDLETV